MLQLLMRPRGARQTAPRRFLSSLSVALRSVAAPAAQVQEQPAATTVMSFPTRKGAVVEVTSTATGSDSYRAYRWECTAGHQSNAPRSYASLVFASRDAETHAAGCRKRPKRGIAEAPVTAPDPTDIYTADDMPALAVIAAAAAEYDRAADQARRADRGKRAARKVLDRLPAGLYGGWLVSRTPSSRQTADLDEIRATYKRLGLGPVPMKQSAPSLKVARAEVLAEVAA